MEWLQMKYHPAKKEVSFRRFQNDYEVKIDPISRLMQYMSEKGRFVLQNHGSEFFDDIAYAFDGQDSVDIEVITTKLDYDDLVQMVDLYNVQSKHCKINLTRLIELPDMVETYLEVKKCGEQAVTALADHCQKLCQINLSGDKVKKSAESFISKINDEIHNIRDRISGLSDNHVNLCFAGVYSSGKSTLINAILGYRILPESIESKTAKMVKVFSPKPGESIKIKFSILGKPAEIEWDQSARCFAFSKGPSENKVRAGIQKVITAAKESGGRQHEQIYQILEYLNGCAVNEISPEITVRFPIPLDSEKVQFVIYDTPGTDSNYDEHKKILDDALKVQSHSILIFVLTPDKMEGEGNNILLDYLKSAEENDGRTSIDISRSIFVINKAETEDVEARYVLQTKTIQNKGDDSWSIKLSDKKLFFLSARFGYVAKAVANGIATKKDAGYFNRGEFLEDEEAPESFCYRQNRCATSDYATGKMLERCEKSLTMAQKSGDQATVLSVVSGLYALEQEIVQYGEKYAVAVKVFAIIDSINRALIRLANEVISLKESNQRDVAEIEREIAELEKTLKSAIAKAVEAGRISPKQVPEDTCKILRVDAETFHNTIYDPIENALNSQLRKGFFGLGRVKVKDEDRGAVRNIIYGKFETFTKEFLHAREALLEQQRDFFIEQVQKAITDNGKISDEAKKYFLTIPKSSIKDLKLTTDLDKIFDSHSRVSRVLIFKKESLDKEGFIRDTIAQLMKEAEMMRNDYLTDYCSSLEKLTEKTEQDFKSRLSDYSLTMAALIQDRDTMKKVGDRMSAAADELDKCLKQLDQIIWRESENV